MSNKIGVELGFRGENEIKGLSRKSSHQGQTKKKNNKYKTKKKKKSSTNQKKH
jgi:hypothetical protein